MATLNATATNPRRTHEGAVASPINPTQELRRSVMANMLWEGEFYESGTSNATRIAELVKKVAPTEVSKIAIEARTKMKLRHVPLLLARELARGSKESRLLVADTLEQVIQRPDELSEFLSIYWTPKKEPLSAQVKKGLARAFTKFNEYSLAKYRGDDKVVKLRDVLFLSHAKPKDAEQAAVWKKLVDGTLETPDTWEAALSATKGENKTTEWTRLLEEGKLGALALLRNLRNMTEAGVEKSLIREGLLGVNVERVLPFRFISAARHAPWLEPELEQVMYKCVEGAEKLPGRTVLLVDVSGSMDQPVSGKSQIVRMDAAAGLAILLREICQEVGVATFSDGLAYVPPRRGFALRDAIVGSQRHNGTQLGASVNAMHADVFKHGGSYDRIIVITDEQSHDSLGSPMDGATGYVINVASYQNGVGYGPYNHIDGWSEAVVDYIKQLEEQSAKH